MPRITNTTPKPLSVPLPGRKRLFLGPRQGGEVAAKALEHPPLKALLESGELELAFGGGAKHGRAARGGGLAPKSRQADGGIRRTGDG